MNTPGWIDYLFWFGLGGLAGYALVVLADCSSRGLSKALNKLAEWRTRRSVSTN